MKRENNFKKIWIDLKDQVPEISDKSDWSDELIVSDGENVYSNVHMKYYDESNMIFVRGAFGYDYDSFHIENVTHWQLLPAPPES